MRFKSYKDLDAALTPEQHAEVERMIAEAKANTPECLRNLVWADGEMYYVDDDGKRIDKPVDAQKVSEIMVAGLPAEPLLVNGQPADRAAILQGMFGDLPGQHPGCPYLADTYCNKCGWVKK